MYDTTIFHFFAWNTLRQVNPFFLRPNCTIIFLVRSPSFNKRHDSKIAVAFRNARMLLVCAYLHGHETWNRVPGAVARFNWPLKVIPSPSHNRHVFPYRRAVTFTEWYPLSISDRSNSFRFLLLERSRRPTLEILIQRKSIPLSTFSRRPDVGSSALLTIRRMKYNDHGLSTDDS